ncbi:MAG: sodium:proton antiporter [Bifidobacteriaceae bacterium]|nr:sodium:proton antiporter [Bifidobacteriaceae bacterium]
MGLQNALKQPKVYIIAGILLLALIPQFFGTVNHAEVSEIGNVLPAYSIIPFVGMLLAIAILPLIASKWWEKNQFYVSIAWGLLFLIPFAIFFGAQTASFKLFEMLIADYLPFIVLLWGLFTVSGGILIRGSLSGTPRVNVILLLIGTILSSIIGTTGASMLMIRPILRANKQRKNRANVVIFFIFLVSNIGGCLTPIGDPPLFLGFLRGIPFFWTFALTPLFLLNTALLLITFYIVDTHNYKKEQQLRITQSVSTIKEPIQIEGAHNLLFIAMIVGAVILSGVLASMPALQNEAGEPLGIAMPYGLTLQYSSIAQMAIIVLAGLLSLRFTHKETHTQNGFSWSPIIEVATLFTGIFITMIPALELLHARGAELGLSTPEQFFWVTGALSSFLDNAPTYLVFMTTASSLPADPATAIQLQGSASIDPMLLLAVSAGAVFMGAITYIGNAPNFMVRSIAEQDKVSMPSFFGYMTYSLRYLIPVFLVDTVMLMVMR